MSDDKRAEAMRKAIADSDAQKSSSSKPEKGSKFNLKDKVKIPGGSEGIKDKFAELWGSKMGKLGIGAVAGVIVLILWSVFFRVLAIKQHLRQPNMRFRTPLSMYTRIRMCRQDILMTRM